MRVSIILVTLSSLSVSLNAGHGDEWGNLERLENRGWRQRELHGGGQRSLHGGGQSLFWKVASLLQHPDQIQQNHFSSKFSSFLQSDLKGADTQHELLLLLLLLKQNNKRANWTHKHFCSLKNLNSLVSYSPHRSRTITGHRSG